MKTCKEVRKLFIEALYSELDAESRRIFDSHLEICLNCRKKFRKMKRALAIMNQHVRTEPDQEFRDRYWGKLEQRMQREAQTSRQPSGGERYKGGWQQWVYRAAAVIFLIGVGVVLGKLWIPPPEPVAEIQRPKVP